MREFVQKQNQTQKRKSVDPARSRKGPPKAITDEHAVLRMKRTIRNQAVLRMLRSQEQDTRRAGTAAQASRSGPQAKRNVSQVDHMREVATKGVAGSATSLPHLDAIQRSFGNHDVSKVQAHTDPQATDSNRALDAVGYTIGNHVAFAGSPDLHTAAHEAAHVVQQRGEVQLSGGLGQAGDAYERHADAVANRVVRGESAHDLLSRASRGSLSHKPVARKAVDDSKSRTAVWVIAKPIAIVDGPRKDFKDINLGIVDLVDKIYVYRVPSRSFETENVDKWSIATRELVKAKGDSMDGMEIRITVGFRQRSFGTLPVVKYEKVQWNFA